MGNGTTCLTGNDRQAAIGLLQLSYHLPLTATRATAAPLSKGSE
jgi:hypothetical protein